MIIGYSRNFVPITPDPDFASVKLLLGFEGANFATGAPGFTDESSAAHGTGTVSGPQISTAAHRFGSTSARFSSSGRVFFADDADWNLAGGNFTVEMWIRPTVIQFQFLIGQWTTTGTISWVLYLGSDGKLNWNTSTTGSDNNNDIAGSAVCSIDTWYHVAIDYDGSKYRTYVNGVMDGSFSTPRTLFDAPTQLSIGSNSNGGAFYYGGYIDEVRLTKGVARYASDGGLTVPTSRFPRS